MSVWGQLGAAMKLTGELGRVSQGSVTASGSGNNCSHYDSTAVCEGRL